MKSFTGFVYCISLIIVITTGCVSAPSHIRTESSNTYDTKTDIDHYLRDGIKHHQAGNYDTAITQYKSALAIDPSHSAALYELGLTYMSAQRNHECIAVLKKGLKTSDSLRTELTMLLGTCYSQSGDTQRAIDVYLSGLRSAPNDSSLHYNVAITYAKNLENSKAIYHLQQSIKNNPAYASPYLVLGEMYRRTNRRVPAVFFFMQFALLEQNTNRTRIAARGVFSLSAPDGQANNNIAVNLDSDEDADAFLALDIGLQMLAMEAGASGKKNQARDHVGVLMGLLELTSGFKNDKEIASTFIWQYAGKNINALYAQNNFEHYAYSLANKASLQGAEQWLQINPLPKKPSTTRFNSTDTLVYHRASCRDFAASFRCLSRVLQ